MDRNRPRSSIINRATHPPETTRGFALLAAAIAIAFAAVGGLIIAGAGSSPVGQIMAVLVGFLVLGAGAVLALSLTSSGDRDEEWPW